MLVLSRRPHETVLFDGAISVEILKIRGNRVVLGIKAPDNVRISRSGTAETKSDPATNGRDLREKRAGRKYRRSSKARRRSAGFSRLRESATEYRAIEYRATP